MMLVVRLIHRQKQFYNQVGRNKAKYSSDAPEIVPKLLPEFREGLVKIDDWRINYTKVGRGDHHVLCLPGAFGTLMTDFSKQVEGFDLEKITLVGYDTPGFGKSTPPTRDFRKDFHYTDAHLLYRLMQAINVPKYSLLGWSYGGIVSLIHAAVYSDAVQKLVVCGAQSGVLPQECANYEQAKVLKKLPSDLYRTRATYYGEETTAKNWALLLDVMASKYQHLDGDICSNLLQHIRCPTLILYGSDDSIVDSSHVTYLNTHIKNSRAYIFPGGKHNIQSRHPEDFNKRVQEFLLKPSI